MGRWWSGWNARLVVVLFLTVPVAAEAAPRWAVLTSGSVQQSGLGNLLTVRLSEVDGIELVERDEVERVLREQALDALVESAATGQPRKIARLLRAQRLLVIDGSWTQSQAELRIVIDDTVIGARLFDEPLTLAKPDPEKICSTVIDLLEDSMRRFPEGIRSAIAVPFFVSKSLEKQYDSLQQEYAKVVGQSLMRAPGIAVVSLDELQHIRAELAVSSSEIERVVPLQVNGEFTVLPASEGETPRCHLTVTISDGASTLETIDHPSIELTQVRELLVGSVTERILAKVGDESIQPMSKAEQEAALAARADRFVEYGAYRLAIKLREAILLLNPGNVEQRIALLSDHNASHPSGDLPYTFPHVEFLLKNRLLKLPQAQSLIPRRDYYFSPKPSSLPAHLNDDYVYAITLAKLAADLPYDPEDAPKFPFRQVVPEATNEARQRREFIRLVGRQVLARANDWNQARKLNDLRDVLERVPEFDGMIPLMPEIVTSERFSEKEVSELCKALRATKKQGPIQFAEYVEVLLKAECHPTQISHSDLDAIESLEKLALGFQGPIGKASHHEYWRTVKELTELKPRIAGLVRLNVAEADGEPRNVLTAPRFPPPRVETIEEPITVERIADWDFPQSLMSYSNGVQPSYRPLDCQLVQHGDSLDIVWNAAVLHSLSRNSEGKLEFHKVFQPSLGDLYVRNDLAILRVRSDGMYLWVATLSGVFVIDAQGEVLADFTSADGLPGYSSWQSELTERRSMESPQVLPDGEKIVAVRGIPLSDQAADEFRGVAFHDQSNPQSEEKGRRIAFLSVFPVAPGRCLAVGRYGPQQATWIAALDWNPSESTKKVHVLHRAERLLRLDQYANQEVLQSPEQIDLAFNIPWMCLGTDGKAGTPVVVIGRNHDTRSGRPIENTPLAVDLETWAVTTLAERIPGLADVCGGTDAECVGGSLVLADRGEVTAFVRQEDGSFLREVIAAESTQCFSLVRFGDELISPGRSWYRMTFADGFKSKLLAKGTRIGGDRLDGFAPSANFGIWARSRREPGIACRIDPDTPRTTARSPLARRMSWEGWCMCRPIIERIRDLGGSVETSGEISRPQLFKEPLTGQASGIAMCLTRQWRGGDDGLRDLADLGIINALFLVDADVSDEGICCLHYAPRQLYLANTRITKKGLEALDFSMTQVLWLEDRTGELLNDETLGLLENARNLKYLALIGPGFGEKARQFVAKCTGLRDARLNPEDRSTDAVARAIENPITEPPEEAIAWEQGVEIQGIMEWSKLDGLRPDAHLGSYQPGSDLVWDERSVHLLSRDPSGQLVLKPVFVAERLRENGPEERVVRVRSMGETIWIATTLRIVAISGSGEKVGEFTKEGGLPIEAASNCGRPRSSHSESRSQKDGVNYYGRYVAWCSDEDVHEFRQVGNVPVSVFPLASGKCLAYGRSGAFGRTWIALLSFEAGKPTMRVLHTATRMLERDAYDDKEMLALPQQTDLVFDIPWACSFKTPQQPENELVVVGRNFALGQQTWSGTPLVIDLNSLEVTTLAQRVPELAEVRGGTVARCVQGALVLNDSGRLEVFCPQKDGAYVKTVISEKRTQNLFLLEREGAVYSPGLTWYRIGPPRSDDSTPDTLGPETVGPETVRLNTDLCVETVSGGTIPAQGMLGKYSCSSLFKIWAIREDGTAAFAIDPDTPSRRELSLFAAFVPEEFLEGHLAAVQAIRDLGGLVDRSGRCQSSGTRTGRMASGSTVVCLTEQWRGGDEGLRLLCDLHGPIRLYLLSAPVSDEGMSQLKDLAELRDLVLSKTPVTTKGLRCLPLKELVSVHLEGQPGGVDYSDDTLSIFTDCWKLTSITLCGEGFTENGVTQLKRFPLLQRLRLVGTLIPEHCKNDLRTARLEGDLLPDAVAEQRLAEKKAAAPRFSALYLGGKDPADSSTRRYARRLASSIVLEAYRQAVLIAARDELGVQTRDHWLDEALEERDRAVRLDLGWTVPMNGSTVVCEFQTDRGNDGTSVRSVSGKIDTPHTVGNAIDFFDEASRSLFVTALTECGLGGQGNRWLDEAPVPREIERLLTIPEFPAQYSAVRKLHQLIRNDGESPQRLSALVWGYLHLGYLTESLLHPMNEVFKMRAVLYAKRLENHAVAMGHGRGIAEVALSLAGLHEIAMDCGRSVGDSPPWLALGKPYYMYDFDEFTRLRQSPELTPWAELFEFNALMYTGREAEARRRQSELLTAYPGCQRFWTLHTYGPMLNPVPNSEKPTRRFGNCLYPELASIADLPGALRPIVAQGEAMAKEADAETGVPDEEFPLRRNAMDSLSDPGGCGSLGSDPNELSWQVLGGWIREVSFSQVLLRAYYLHIGGWAGNGSAIKDAWITRTDPLTKGHPWRKFLDVYSEKERGRVAERSFPETRAELEAIVYRFTRNDRPVWYGCEDTTADRVASIAGGIVRDYLSEEDIRHVYHQSMPFVYFSDHPGRESNGRGMRCSPWNPWFVLFRIDAEYAREEVRTQFDIWWKHFENDPDVRRAIALAHARNKEYELAADRLATVLGACKRPDREVCEALANVYDELGDTAKAEATLKAFLHGGEAATAEEARLAFNRGSKQLENGDCVGAKTWFDRAAGSDNPWGYFARMLAAELRGDHEASGRAARQLADTHPANAVQWYWSRLRGNEKDRKAALDAVKNFQQMMGTSLQARNQKNNRTHTLIILGLEGVESPEEVCNAFLEADILPFRDTYAALHVLMLAMEHNLPDVRKRLLERMNRPNAEEILARAFYRLVEQGDGDQTALTDADFDKLVEGASPSERVDVEYFFAKWLAIQGHEERACQHWRHVLETPMLIKITRNLAIHELRKRGMTEEEYRQLSGITP